MPDLKVSNINGGFKHVVAAIALMSFLLIAGFFIITQVILPPRKTQVVTPVKITLTKKVVSKTITTNTTDVSAIDRILAKKSRQYLAQITNLKQYRVESTLLDDRSWLITLHRK